MSLDENAKGPQEKPQERPQERPYDRGKDGANYADVRQRLAEFKETLPGKKSWGQLADLTGIPEGTVSQFVTGTYQGRYDLQAEKAEKFFATLASKSAIRREVQKVPGFVLTKTAENIRSQLIWAHNGNMVTVSGAPGVGKTLTLKDYVENASNAWMITASPAISSLVEVLHKIAITMRLSARSSGVGGGYLTSLIREFVMRKEALLVIDEAGELSDEAISELRHIYDETGLGIAFCGNSEVLTAGVGSGKKAQLFSRNASRLLIDKPFEADIDALLERWSVTVMTERDFLRSVALRPGGGALRAMTQVLKMATMVADSKGEERVLKHLQNAATHHGYRVERVA